MLFDETLVDIQSVPRFLKKRIGKSLHRSCLYRWRRDGIQGVKLETRRIGKRFYTSKEALDRFFEAMANLPKRTERTPAETGGN